MIKRRPGRPPTGCQPVIITIITPRRRFHGSSTFAITHSSPPSKIGVATFLPSMIVVGAMRKHRGYRTTRDLIVILVVLVAEVLLEV
eukprot:3053833-Pyramimonas_sp.AAC.1